MTGFSCGDQSWAPYRTRAPAHYQGWVCLEYVCVDWRRCNECDVLTETLLLRDALRVALDSTDGLIISAD